MIRVILVARTLRARAGLRSLVERDGRCHVVEDASEIGAVGASSSNRADVLLLDGEGLGADSISSALVRPMPGIVLLGGSSGHRSALLSLGSPVGLLSDDASSEQIQASIFAVAAGLTVVEPDGRALSLRFDDDEFDAPILTAREREVLELVAAGLPNKGIAARLGISDHTVKFHLASVLAKLGAASRAEAVARGARLGLIAL